MPYVKCLLSGRSGVDVGCVESRLLLVVIDGIACSNGLMEVGDPYSLEEEWTKDCSWGRIVCANLTVQLVAAMAPRNRPRLTDGLDGLDGLDRLTLD